MSRVISSAVSCGLQEEMHKRCTRFKGAAQLMLAYNPTSLRGCSTEYVTVQIASAAVRDELLTHHVVTYASQPLIH